MKNNRRNRKLNAIRCKAHMSNFPRQESLFWIRAAGRADGFYLHKRNIEPNAFTLRALVFSGWTSKKLLLVPICTYFV